MPVRFFMLCLLLAASPGAAQGLSREDAIALHERLRDDFRACRDPSMRYPQKRNYDPRWELTRELQLMLKAPAETCPDTPGRARAFLEATLGDPVRADADTGLVAMLEYALREGNGGPAQPERAARLARLLWLIETPRLVPGMDDEALQAWLAGPEAVALLEARIAAAPTARAIWLRAGQLLDRSRADYDPARAVALLGKSPDKESRTVRLLLVELLSDGSHLPPDFARAAALFRYDATRRSERTEAQRVMLRIGRRALAAARTEADRLGALAILAAASLDGVDDSRALYEKQLARVRAPRLSAPLPADRVEWVRAEMDFAFAHMLDGLPDETPASDRPIAFEGLLGPDGRLVTVRLVRSSGVKARDHAVRAAWLGRGAVVDLSSVARGRTVWTPLPPLDPMFDYSAAWDHRKARCPFCS